MKIMVRILALALGLSTDTVFAADGIPRERAMSRLVDTSYVFPSSGNVQGNGAYFKTRMVLVNPTKSPMTINAVLSTPGGPVGPQAISLVSGETKVYENVLADVFGHTGGAGIRLWESTDTRPFVASAEVYADSTAGRYSTPVFGMSSDDQAARVSDTGHSFRSAFGWTRRTGRISAARTRTVPPFPSGLTSTLRRAAFRNRRPSSSWIFPRTDGSRPASP